MASSNRHWPSMFKSKPCNAHHQWQHDINSSLISTGCHRSPYTSVGGCEDRSPEPKPRWNPKPEQIRILEAIFNSGMVNPPRDEIRKIRAQLQEYGQVGDANVFYWFQNRKSRSKHKLRHLQNSKNNNQTTQQAQNPCSFPSTPIITTNTAPISSSSSSSDKSTPIEIPTKAFSIGFSNVNEVVPNCPTTSMNQTYFHPHNEKTTSLSPAEPFFFPMQVQHNGAGGVGNMTQGFCFSELSNVVQLQNQAHSGQENVETCTNLLLSEIIMNNNHGGGVVASSKKEQDREKVMKMMQQHPQLSFCVDSAAASTSLTHNTIVPPITSTTTVTVPSPIPQVQGVGEAGAVGPAAGATKSTVFINDVAFEVAAGPFNVREAFGDDVVLIHGASGQAVLTNEWGVTHSLQHGAFYYLI
ncbi:hypothetical protein L6164_029696 [Bauhinia variegata]|uniref:Uncharacterized protein n=1 Tax=Bauhinia variegata TaxID=167791 RepID=A0ACB9LAI6_BAUVA|nr:hypothetical protein L6164_029696 [Bauhinia variegata]